MKVEEKAIRFLTALLDAYRDEDNRELDAFSKMELGDDFTGDCTAMLLATHSIFKRIVGEDTDLIDFTHILNKLAIQYVMDGMKNV